MRFAGNTSNVGSYIQAGRAGAKGAADFFKVARANAPDYGGLAEANMNSRSAERIAATQAEAAVAQAGLKAKADVKQTRIITEAEGKILDKKIDAKRKAGMVGMFGAAAGGLFLGMENKKAEAKAKERDAVREKRENARFAHLQARIDGIPQAPELKPYQAGEPPESKPFVAKPFDPSSVTGKGGDGSLVSSAQAVAAGKGNSSKGGKYSQSQMADFATQAGFSPEQARIMAAIGMGESGGDAGIDTVQSGLDPGKSNEYSLGLFQINAQAHGDKLAKLGYTAEDLRDPLKNAKVAKLVHDEVGGFGPWSVYSKGIYKNYL